MPIQHTLFQEIQKQIDQLGYLGHSDIASGLIQPGQEWHAPIPVKQEHEWYHGSMFISEDRLQRYADFEDMDLHPFTSAIFDIYAEQASQPDPWGNVMQVISPDRAVKDELTELFFDRLNINQTLYDVVRSTVKTGDHFLYMVLQRDRRGILFAKDIPAYTIWRLEWEGKLFGFVQYTPGGQTPVLDPFTVVHFKTATGKEKYRPYGTAILDAARRHYRQLKLMEDAMVVYRITRAPERRVFFINTARVPPAKAEGYIEQVIHKFRKKPFINPLTSEIDWRSNQMCVSGDTEVPLLSGEIKTIRELAKDHEDSKKNWVYSVDPTNGCQIVPDEIEWAGMTRQNAQMVKVTLDNGESVKCTPDHKFPLRDGTKCQAQNLRPGDSMMPFYRKHQKINGSKLEKNKPDYEAIHDIKSQKWIFTHRLVAESVHNHRGGYNLLIHHKDFNSLNNSPENLKIMSLEDHGKLHKELGRRRFIAYNKSPEKIAAVRRSNLKRNSKKYIIAYNNSPQHAADNAIRSEAFKKTWNENRELFRDRARLDFDEKTWTFLRTFVQENPGANRDQIIEALQDNMLDHLLDLNPEYRWAHHYRSGHKKLSRMVVQTRMEERYGTKSFKEFKQIALHNHKVISVEFLDEREDTYTLTIKRTHNYSLQIGIFSLNSPEEDFFIPIRDGQEGTRIDTLPGAENLGEVDDVKWFKDQILTVAKVPRVYINDPDGGSSERRENLAQIDSRFAISTMRIQSQILEGYTKAAIVHLLLRGYTKDRALNFRLELTNPSHAFEKQELEVERDRLGLLRDYTDAGFARSWVWEKVMHLAPSEIKRMIRRRHAEDLLLAYQEAEVEAYRDATVQRLTTAFEEPEEGGGDEEPRGGFAQDDDEKKVLPPGKNKDGEESDSEVVVPGDKEQLEKDKFSVEKDKVKLEKEKIQQQRDSLRDAQRALSDKQKSSSSTTPSEETTAIAKWERRSDNQMLVELSEKRNQLTNVLDEIIDKDGLNSKSDDDLYNLNTQGDLTLREDKLRKPRGATARGTLQMLAEGELLPITLPGGANGNRNESNLSDGATKMFHMKQHKLLADWKKSEELKNE